MRNVLMTLMMVGAAVAATGCDLAIEGGAPAEGSLEATALLRFVDYRGTTVRVLEIDGGLPRSAATRIVAWRDGADGIPGTKDDDVFGSIDELATVSRLADDELMRLAQLAVARGWDDGDDAWIGVYDGVGFSLGDAEATLEVANNAPADVLDVDAALRSDAVANIVSARPLVSVEQLAGLPRVGQYNLERLRDWSLARAEAIAAGQVLAE